MDRTGDRASRTIETQPQPQPGCCEAWAPPRPDAGRDRPSQPAQPANREFTDRPAHTATLPDGARVSTDEKGRVICTVSGDGKKCRQFRYDNPADPNQVTAVMLDKHRELVRQPGTTSWTVNENGVKQGTWQGELTVSKEGIYTVADRGRNVTNIYGSDTKLAQSIQGYSPGARPEARPQGPAQDPRYTERPLPVPTGNDYRYDRPYQPDYRYAESYGPDMGRYGEYNSFDRSYDRGYGMRDRNDFAAGMVLPAIFGMVINGIMGRQFNRDRYHHYNDHRHMPYQYGRNYDDYGYNHRGPMWNQRQPQWGYDRRYDYNQNWQQQRYQPNMFDFHRQQQWQNRQYDQRQTDPRYTQQWQHRQYDQRQIDPRYTQQWQHRQYDQRQVDPRYTQQWQHRQYDQRQIDPRYTQQWQHRQNDQRQIDPRFVQQWQHKPGDQRQPQQWQNQRFDHRPQDFRRGDDARHQIPQTLPPARPQERPNVPSGRQFNPGQQQQHNRRQWVAVDPNSPEARNRRR